MTDCAFDWSAFAFGCGFGVLDCLLIVAVLLKWDPSERWIWSTLGRSMAAERVRDRQRLNTPAAAQPAATEKADAK